MCILQIACSDQHCRDYLRSIYIFKIKNKIYINYSYIIENLTAIMAFPSCNSMALSNKATLSSLDRYFSKEYACKII